MPEELELLNEWQNRLSLNDWFITLIDKCKATDLEINEADGVVSYTEVTKSAIIKIVSPEEHDNLTVRPYNFEEILVHELLHLKFCLLEQGTDWDNELQLRLLHQIIDDLARALVDAKRSGKNG